MGPVRGAYKGPTRHTNQRQKSKYGAPRLGIQPIRKIDWVSLRWGIASGVIMVLDMQNAWGDGKGGGRMGGHISFWVGRGVL